MKIPQCQKCGKKLDNPHATHCSEECLFDDIKKSKSFVDNGENTGSRHFQFESQGQSLDS